MMNIALLNVRAVAEMLDVSSRQVWRLRDSGAMPEPLRLGDGRCIRWSASTINSWIGDGCPNVRRTRWGVAS